MALEQAWSLLKEKRYHLMDSNKLMGMTRDGDEKAYDEMMRRLGEGVYRDDEDPDIPDFTSMEDNARALSMERRLAHSRFGRENGMFGYRREGVTAPDPAEPWKQHKVTITPKGRPQVDVTVPIGTPYGNPTGEREAFYDWQQKNAGEPMHIDAAWDFVKAAGREHTGSLSMPIAPTGGGSRPFKRNPHTAYNPGGWNSQQRAISNQVEEDRHAEQTESLEDPPEVVAQPVGAADDWGPKDYERFFAQLGPLRNRSRPIGVKTRGWRKYPQHAPPSQI